MEDQTHTALAKVPGLSGPSSKTTVLVADDNREVRNFFRLALQRRFQVLEATNGEDAVRLAQEAHPDVILCDSIMPGLGAREVMQKLQETSDTACIPVIITSGTSEEEAVGKGLPPAAFLQKPFGIEDLYRTVQNCLPRNQSVA